MVKLLIKWLEDGLYFGKVPDPTRRRIDITTQMNCNLKRVAMQATAFMALRDVRQAMRGFEGEFFENFHSVYSS